MSMEETWVVFIFFTYSGFYFSQSACNAFKIRIFDQHTHTNTLLKLSGPRRLLLASVVLTLCLATVLVKHFNGIEGNITESRAP